MKFPDEFATLLHRFRKLAAEGGERPTFLVRFQTIEYLPLVLDRDLKSEDELEAFLIGKSPDGAVSISFNEIIRTGNSVLLGLSDNRRAVMNESVSPRDNRAHGRARNPVLFGRDSNGSAVSHLADNRLFIDGRVARPAEILTLRFRSIDAYLHARPAQTALEPRSRFEHLKDDVCQRLIILALGPEFGMVVARMREFFL